MSGMPLLCGTLGTLRVQGNFSNQTSALIGEDWQQPVICSQSLPLYTDISLIFQQQVKMQM